MGVFWNRTLKKWTAKRQANGVRVVRNRATRDQAVECYEAMVRGEAVPHSAARRGRKVPVCLLGYGGDDDA